ncbi:MAG TPA: DUF4919 domain-containing protein [Methylomirabilota bacterium]|nr:DUF4919 domain-containing protein [Methylomirabilota bacterium]
MFNRMNYAQNSEWRAPAIGVAAAVLILSVSGTTQQKQPDAPASPAGPTYEEMVAKLKQGDLSVDFTDLRMKYAASPQYQPEEGSEEVNTMYQALDIANSVLEKQYVNIDAHMVASVAYAGLNNGAMAKLHHDIAAGLLRSILGSGNGANVETAYKVISVAEEYALMRAMGWRPQKQSYLHQGARSYDEMEMLDTKDNSTLTVYFDTTLSDQLMEKSLGH